MIKALIIQNLSELESTLVGLCNKLFGQLRSQEDIRENGPKKVFMVLANILSNDITIYLDYLGKFKDAH